MHKIGTIKNIKDETNCRTAVKKGSPTRNGKIYRFNPELTNESRRFKPNDEIPNTKITIEYVFLS
jgi:hypothetical protein